MIIDRLTISNFKNYAGVNTIDLTVAEGKNLILVGGLNGYGKTTMSEAIRICLYGSKFMGKHISDSKYQDYLKSTWNYDRRTKKDRFYLEMDVRINDGITSMNFTITREFVPQKGGFFEEKLLLTKDGKDIEIVDRNYWEYFVEKMMPPHILNYFFFDGEKTTEIITSSDASEYLSNAVNDITGISELNVLKNDLSEVKRRISRSGMKASVDKKVNSFEAQISEINNNNSDILGEIENFKSLIDEEENKKTSLNGDMKRAIGVKEKNYKKIGSAISVHENEYGNINDSIYEFASSSLPFIIAGKVFDKTVDAAKTENISISISQSSEIIDALLVDLQESVEKLVNKTENVRSIFSGAREKLETLKKEGGSRVIDLTPTQISRMSSILDVDRDSFIIQFEKREKIKNEIEDLKKDQSKFADQNLGSLMDHLKVIDEKILTIKEEITKRNGILEYNKKEIEKLKTQIYDEERAVILDIRDQEAVKIIDEASKNIDGRINKISKEGLYKLEENINAVYRLLKNKEDMIKKIIISSDYEIRPINYSGKEISVSGMSAGEKGVLMYSVVYSLLKLSMFRLPIIIDSPLGKMDSTHVENIVENLYPKLGEQIIILSHNREITDENIGMVEPIMSSCYTICKDPPKFKKGYFGVK